MGIIFWIKFEFLRQGNDKIIKTQLRQLMPYTAYVHLSEIKTVQGPGSTWLSIIEASFEPELKACLSFTDRGGALDPNTVVTLTW